MIWAWIAVVYGVSITALYLCCWLIQFVKVSGPEHPDHEGHAAYMAERRPAVAAVTAARPAKD